jgi:hypothetical protein
MAYRLDGRNSISGGSQRFFASPQLPDRLWDPPSLIHNRYRGSSPRVKRPVLEADSPPSSADVNKGGTVSQLPYTSLWRGA